MEKYLVLVGFKGSVIELSNRIKSIDKVADDICEFGNLDEILESGVMMVAIDETGEEHITIEFTADIADTNEEHITASIVKVAEVY